MKHYLFLFSVMALSASCAREQQSAVNPTVNSGAVVNGYRTHIVPGVAVSSVKTVPSFQGTSLDNIPRIEARSAFAVTLQDMDGKTVSDLAQLHSSTQYKLLITGSSNVQYHIQQYDGFELIKQDPTRGVYVIQSSSNLGKTMYMKVVPLLTEGNSLRQARPQTVTLVNYN